jgi:hypothetical protein
MKSRSAHHFHARPYVLYSRVLIAPNTFLPQATYGMELIFSKLIFPLLYQMHGARGSVDVKAVCHKPGGRRFETRTRPWGLLSV